MAQKSVIMNELEKDVEIINEDIKNIYKILNKDPQDETRNRK